MYAKTLMPGSPKVPALVATTADASVVVLQLLERGWALLGSPPPQNAAGELVISGDRLRLVIDGQAVLDSVNPPGPDGWWTAVDQMEGRCAVVICPDRLNLTSADLGRRLTELTGTGLAVFAAVPVRMELPG